MTEWREVCERKGGPVCDEDMHCSTCSCPGLVADERDRLARFSMKLAEYMEDNFETTADPRSEMLLRVLWQASAK